MIVDSSALPEQVVRDALTSAFNSAGQRCSALRMLCLPEHTADDILRMLAAPWTSSSSAIRSCLSTDVGPVIDRRRSAALMRYIGEHAARVVHRCSLRAPRTQHGLFVAPTIIELPRAAALTREVFGPVLHVVRYDPRAPRRARRRDQRLGLRAHARCAYAHRRDGAADRATRAGRQRLRQPQHDRCRRRRAAVRRHGLVRHGAEGRRAALRAAFCDRAHGHDEHGRRRRQRDATVARRRARAGRPTFGDFQGSRLSGSISGQARKFCRSKSVQAPGAAGERPVQWLGVSLGTRLAR